MSDYLREIKEQQALLAEILNDLDEMIEELGEAIEVEDDEEIYKNAKELVEYYIRTKKKLKLN
ncbi:hypothetical protein CFTD6783_02270 [Campylobacter fetus subsp. testudinum]|uniref:hypothetical protein n=1 Tax=Campylobacter fetus TaxID=196 RepID=UPI0008189979|nr:hypothetical protein [Campylobacter fetus]OCS10384.1 hypothetical protein CFTD6783_02270 [Campylobacter fetus subsp. testudinum]